METENIQAEVKEENISNEDNITRYKWTGDLKIDNEAVESDEFFLTNMNNFGCRISMKLDKYEDLIISVKKSYYQAARATISIFSLEDKLLATVSTENWKKCCEVPKILNATLQLGSTDDDELNGFSLDDDDQEDHIRSCFIRKAESEYRRRTCSVSYPAELPACNITLVCVIKWLGFTDDFYSSLSLQKGLRDYCLQSDFADLGIEIGDDILPVHKIILVAQSKKFLKKINDDNASIEINDVDSETMKEVLMFLYTGKTKAAEETEVARKVFSAATNYEILQLKSLCENTLMRNMAIDNVLAIVDMAYKLKATKLYEKSLAYMVKNREEILKLKDFKSNCVNNPEMMFQFMELIISQK
ncbi:TD and POZ domain-containing protein 5-like [Microplitis mediator]|uniref:TD and POZ domain-containing protein 5-like n=1 Tax=Microplitis mediator TaxID=375433 RepID=UPI002552DF95|nr:TD and POZ domain-containing protein 5-like [Microplitis mediator]